MSSQLNSAWRSIVPDLEDRHGPLPPVLLLLTVVTGLVDAFSYLLLGHVFVANMTGNVVFLAFSLAGSTEFTIWASALALVAFSVGALLGGRIAHGQHAHRGRTLLFTMTLETLLVCTALIIALSASSPFGDASRATLITVIGVGMGLQNATARALGVPDLTTTVLTLTITGISADSRLAGGQSSRAGRRLLSVLSMLLGALIGAIFINHGLGNLTLLLAAVLLVVLTVVSAFLARSKRGWVSPL
jgi:uncharacterized membrane protein YoaK (UPF0700 family)